jgi:hypothetical protein
MQLSDLDKTKVLKRQRDPMSDERKTKFQSVLKSLLLVIQVMHIGQSGWTHSRASLVHQTCPVSPPDSREVIRICPVNIVIVVI